MTKLIKIKLNLTNNTVLDTSKLKYKTVLFFYPKAMTSGCSIEVQDFQKKLTTFKKLGFDVFGASKDTVEKNSKFSDKYKLKYELGSDLTDACDKLGIWIEKSMYGKKYFGINRSTFILNKKGKILHSWLKVKVKDHVEEVISFIKDGKL
ncbi:peroxiredoxin [Alphaproteobacteria bacterium]|nr:peroxiredoxin [Alphaproteobacteria bacterium]